jgi:hypothetical protein
VEAWLEGLLGDPARYQLTVRFVDPVTGEPVAEPVERTLADVGLAALDLVFLAPVGEETGLGRLGSVLAAWAEGLRSPSVPETAALTIDTAVGDPTIDGVAVVCRQLRRLVAEARDLDGRDLAAPDTAEAASGLDVAELETRLGRVVGALTTGRNRLAKVLPEKGADKARGDVRAAMLALAGFELAGGVPLATDPPALVAEGTALLAQVDARLAEYRALVAEQAEGWPALDEFGRLRALRARAELVVGHALPLAPRFAAANGAELDGTFGRPRLETREDATGWLAAAGRVDPGARRLRVAIDLVEAVGGEVAFDFSLGQLPDYEDEGWAAVERPARDERGRLCLLATGEAPSFAGGQAAGLLLGSWTESVPRLRQTAGLAVHFDSPSARAPQAVLVCTAEGDSGYDFELVRDLVKQTLDLARLRMVGPETLEGLGQYLPAAHLDYETTPVGEP